MFNPLVSVIIPVYNGSNYIKEAIDSALAQTYDNIEIIVVNDGSIDDTEKIVKSYGDKIRYFSKENGGVASALNLALKEMRGEYFSWLSHDDAYLSEKIENQIRHLSLLGDKDIILYSDYELMDEESNVIENIILDHEMLEAKPEYALFRNLVNGITLLIPKKAFGDYGFFNEELKCTQDYDMWFEMMKSYEFIHLPEVLVKYRIHEMQDTKKNPRVITEGDDLWIKMIEKLPIETKIKLEGRECCFYRKMALFLERTSPYRKAKDFCNNQMRQLLLKQSECNYCGYPMQIQALNKKIVDLEKELCFIMSSKFWKVRTIYLKIKFALFSPQKFLKKYFKKFKLHNKKKILICMPWISRGGVEKVIFDLVKNLNGYEVFLVTTLQHEYDLVIESEFKKLVKNVYHLPEFLKEEEYLHFVDDLISSNEINVILVTHCSWAYESMQFIRNKYENIKIFDLIHNSMPEGFGKFSRQYSQWIDKTIAISNEAADFLVKDLDISVNKVVRILNGVDNERIFNRANINAEDARREFGFPEDKLVVTFIGRLSPEKNPLKFIQIAKELNKESPGKYFFVMSGRGELKELVTDEIEKNFNDKEFAYIGNCHNPEKVLFFTHVLVNTSSIEGMPLTILESLSMDVPVIAPNIGAISEIIKNEYNGLLLKKNSSIQDYLDAVIEFDNWDLRKKLIRNARKSVERLSSMKMAENYKKVFGK